MLDNNVLKSLLTSLVVLFLLTEPVAAAANFNPNGDFYLQKTFVGGGDEIESGASVFVFVNKNASKTLAKKQSYSGERSSGEICDSARCKRQKSLPSAKINLTLQAQKSLDAGNQFYKNGKFTEAAAAYQKSARLKPNYAAYFGLGEAKFELKDKPQALAAYEKAVSLNPKLDEALYNIGVIRYEQKDYAGALQPLQQAVNIAPVEASEYYYYGLTLNELKRKEEAAAAMREAVSLDPKFVEAYQKLADWYDELGRKNESIEITRQITKADPKNTAALFKLGVFYFNEQKREDALVAYEQVVRLQPNNARATAYLAQTQYVLGDYQNSIKNYQKAAALEPELKKDTDQFLTPWGYAYLSTNNYAEALKTLIEAEKINQQNYLIYNGIANAEMQSAPPNFPAAIEALNKSVKLNPQYKDTYLLLANAHIQSSPRNPKEALQAAKRAEELAPNDAVTLFWVGSALSIGQLFEEASETLKKAAALEPGNGLVRVQLCNALFVLNKVQEGLPECEQAVKLSKPEDKPLARTTLANMYARARRFDNAIAEANGVVKEQPNFAGAYYSLGTTYFLMKKYDKAIEAMKKVLSLAPELAETHLTLGAIYWEAKKKAEYLQEYNTLLKMNPKYAEQLKAATVTGKKK